MNPNCLLFHIERERIAEVQSWGRGRVVRWCLENIQSRSVQLISIIVGQGSIVLAVGEGGVVWTFFLSSIFSLFFLTLWETARYRLKYCLKGPLNPKQLTNQIQSRVVWEHQSTAATIFTLKFWTKNACRSIKGDLTTQSTILDSVSLR